MNRQLYQTGGNTLPIYPRIEAIETSLGGAEQRIGDPALGQSSNSPLSNVYNNQTSGTGIGSIFGNTGGQQPNPIQPGGAVDPIGSPQQPSMPQPIQPGPSVDPIKPLGPRGPRPFGPQVDPNRDYGFNQYGFDSNLLNYLNRNAQATAIDGGRFYKYNPTTQTFSSSTPRSQVNQYENIPLSVLQQVSTNPYEYRNLLQPYQTGGGGFGPMQQFSYGGRAGYQEGGRIGYQEGGIGMMQDQGMYNPLQSNYYSGMPMMMAGGGIANLVPREKYGLGSKLKKFVRKIIPNEISSIAVKAAPFVAPFNPALAAAMAGIGGFDQTGRIGSSLKSAALTYGAGQLARGIGGAGFQGNPFAGVDFSGGFTSGIGSLFSSPIGTQPFGTFQSNTPTQNLIQTSPGYTGGADALTYDPTTGQQLGRTAEELQKGQLLQSAKELETGMGRSQAELIKAYGTQPGTEPVYFDLIKKAGSFENVPLSERFNAVKDLSTKALKDIYTKPVINPKTGETTYALDKNALFSTFAGASSYVEALQLAKKAGIPEGEFSEADYQRLQIDPKKKQYQEVLKPESFGIRPTKAGGGLMNEGVLSIKLTPAQAMAMGGQIIGRENYGLGSLKKISSTMKSVVNPETQIQSPRLASANPVNDLYKYYLENTSDEDYKKRIMEAVLPRFGLAMGGEIPVRQNQQGVSELDLRAKGGYIPVGIKEKADDVPAMLSRNEFVFTADAVRGAGNGSINKGAQKMYKLMKSLEKKVKKMKKVA